MFFTTESDGVREPATLVRQGEDVALVLQKGRLRPSELRLVNRLTQSACETCPFYRRAHVAQPSALILDATASYVIRWISDNVTSWLGWQPDEIVGRRTFEFIGVDGDSQRRVQTRYRSREFWTPEGLARPIELATLRKDGSTVRLAWSSLRRPDGGYVTVGALPACEDDNRLDWSPQPDQMAAQFPAGLGGSCGEHRTDLQVS